MANLVYKMPILILWIFVKGLKVGNILIFSVLCIFFKLRQEFLCFIKFVKLILFILLISLFNID